MGKVLKRCKEKRKRQEKRMRSKRKVWSKMYYFNMDTGGEGFQNEKYNGRFLKCVKNIHP